jgi:predicted nucleic acid-binding protein
LAARARPRRAFVVSRNGVVEAAFETLPVDEAAARAYGRVYAAVAGTGRRARGRRAFDLLVAATALAFAIPLYTCNRSDFAGLEQLVEVVAVPAS